MSNWVNCPECGNFIVDVSKPCSSCGKSYLSPVASSPASTSEADSKLEEAKKKLETFLGAEGDTPAYSDMFVTNITSLLNIKKIHGLVTAYNYSRCGDTFLKDVEKDELLVEVETIKTNLIKRLKLQAHSMGGNAIIGFVLDVKIDHSNYMSGSLGIGDVGSGKISIIYGISVNAYGTAVTIE